MPTPTIQNSFAGGELAPQMWGRTDLSRYRSGCAVARNVFVDYRGGLSSRAGSQFVGPCISASGIVRLIDFEFSTSQTYAIELSHEAIRFITEGAYVTENPLTITGITNAYPAIFTVSGGTLNQGDQVYISDVLGFERNNGLSAINQRTLIVESPTGSNFSLSDPITGNYVDGSNLTQFLGSGTAARIYTIVSPYQEADLYDIKYTQSADVLDLTHVNYNPMQLSRLGAASWQLASPPIAATIQPPQNLFGQSIGGPGQLEGGPVLLTAYYVTSISGKNGEESVASNVATVLNNPLNQDLGVSNKLTWDAVDGAVGYKIYASISAVGTSQENSSYYVGYIGTTTNTNFQDVNIEPDFSIVPPTGQNPFRLGPITEVTNTYAGYGYISPKVNIADPTGSGAVITATADTSGNGSITGYAISNGGSNYSSPVLTIGESNSVTGSGLVVAHNNSWTFDTDLGGWTPAANSITISNGGTNYHAPTILLTIGIVQNVVDFKSGLYIGKTTGSVVTSLEEVITMVVTTNDGGTSPPDNTDPILFGIVDGHSVGAAQATATVQGENNPSVVSYFDQRKVFAGSTQQPDTMWFSRIGLYNNFDTSFPSQSDDALTATIVSSQVNIIQSLTPMSGGLIALTTNGAFQISGGTPGAPLTPSTITAQAQAFSGANSLQPLRVNYDLIYAQARGSAVRDLTYNFYLNVYTGQDISAQSSHLFDHRNILQWTYAEEPFKLIWCVRDDGIALSLTIMKEQEIYGWTRHDTCGRYVSVTSIAEGDENVVYFVVNRWFNGKFYNVVERQASRFFGNNFALNMRSNPEEAWCVDCGVALQPTPVTCDILYGQPAAIGACANLIITAPGAGYAQAYVQVIDAMQKGTGAQVAVTLSGGAISSVTIVSAGTGYVQPICEIVDPTGAGSGAQISIGVENLWLFITDANTGGSPPTAPAEAGQVIRVAGGIGTVVETSGAVIYADMLQQPAGLLPNSPGAQILGPQAAGTWSLSDPVTVVGGLDHFEGCLVGVVADGNVLPPQTVFEGSITLPVPATYVLAGALFSAQVQTLPWDTGGEGGTVQGRRKNLPAITLRTMDTRGIAVGPSFDQLVEQKERTVEPFALATQFTVTGGWQDPAYTGAPIAPIPPEYKDIRTVLSSTWQEEGFVCVQQNYPMPFTLLAEIPETNLGDTPG